MRYPGLSSMNSSQKGSWPLITETFADSVMYGAPNKYRAHVSTDRFTLDLLEGCNWAIFRRMEMIFAWDVPNLSSSWMAFKTKLYTKRSIFTKKSKTVTSQIRRRPPQKSMIEHNPVKKAEFLAQFQTFFSSAKSILC